MLAPNDRLGANRPPGTPDHADSQVATNFNQVHSTGKSASPLLSSSRVCSWPPAATLLLVITLMTATSNPQNMAKRMGYLR